MAKFGRLYALFALLSLLPGLLTAQITGDLKGTVLDSSGGAVSQAKVTLTNPNTGESRDGLSDTAGRFAFRLLKTGKYEVTVEKPGFRIAQTPAQVRAGETADVRLTVEVGQVTEAVTVTDAVSVLDTANAQIQISVEGAAIQDIPVNRDPNLFALTAPGVTPVSQANPFMGSGSFNANGGRGRGNNVTVDGITATDVSATGTGGVLDVLSFAQIGEVKLITNNFSAEHGRNASSQLLYITRSGTNSLHGEAYDYLQNDKLNARPFFDRSGTTNVVRRNQWGYAVGGPVHLPKLYDGRNRTHFFTTYEGTKIRGAGGARIARVPTASMLAQVTDPTSRALLDQFRIPAAASDAGSFGQVQQSASTTSDAYQFSAKIDHQIGSRDSLTGRYSRFVSDSGSSGLTFIATNLGNFGTRARNLPQQLSLSETHLFSANVVNEFRFGFGRSRPVFTIDSTVPLGPRIRFRNGQVDNFGQWEGLPQGRVQNTFQFMNTLSWVRGAHNVKFGADVHRAQLNSFFDALQRPLIDFADWNDFAAGRPLTVQQRFGSSVRGNRNTNHYYFLQDDWRVTRSLTVNLGVRVEVAGGITEVNGLSSNLNLDCRNSVGAAGSGPFGCFEVGKPAFGGNANWAPRLGFAWNVGSDQKTVIRGGYGITYDFLFMLPIVNQRFLPPFIVTGALSGQSSFTGSNSFANIVAGTSQMQAETRAQSGQLSTSVLNFGSVNPAVAQDMRNPQVHQFSLGIQRELSRDFVLKATYVGTKGNYLQRTRPLNLIDDPRALPAGNLADETARLNDFRAVLVGATGGATRASNRIDPRFNEINLVDSSANSNYHSFQFEAQKRFSHGYFFQTSFTAGKSIDDVSDVMTVLINDSPTQQNPLNNRDNRGPSQFDLARRLVITHGWEPTWGKSISNGLLRRVVAGWGFTGITSFRSGFPVNFESGARRGVSALTLNGIAANAFVRPNAAGPFRFNPRPSGSEGAPSGLNNDGVQRISAYADSLGLSQPLIGNFGNLGRNRFRLNGERNFDWNFYKNVPVNESVKLQVRAEFYNFFNNTAFQDVVFNISNPAFGQYTTTTRDARFMQVAVRAVF